MPRRRATFVLLPLAFAFLALGCSSRTASIRGPVPSWVAKLDTQALEVVDVQATTSTGVHAIFLRLSRFPDSIRYHASGPPARLHLEIGGPDIGSDVGERRIVPADDLVNSVVIERRAGTVYVTMELATEEPPPYSVHELADWLMVRFVPQQ